MNVRQSYSQAIEYIAWNDEPTIQSVEDMEGYATVQLVAYVWKREARRVAADVVEFRYRQGFGRVSI